MQTTGRTRRRAVALLVGVSALVGGLAVPAHADSAYFYATCNLKDAAKQKRCVDGWINECKNDYHGIPEETHPAGGGTLIKCKRPSDAVA